MNTHNVQYARTHTEVVYSASKDTENKHVTQILNYLIFNQVFGQCEFVDCRLCVRLIPRR